MAKLTSLLLVLLVASTPALAADQFDLICKGERKEYVSAKPKPTEVRYRMDIASNSWCREKCSIIEKFEAVEPGRLVLKRKEHEHLGDPDFLQSIDRVTGAWIDRYFEPDKLAGLYWWAEGTCEPAEFSGFPSRKF